MAEVQVVNPQCPTLTRNYPGVEETQCFLISYNNHLAIFPTCGMVRLSDALMVKKRTITAETI